MKLYSFFILFSGLLIIACKKKNPEPVTPKTTHYLKHSGIADSNTFVLDTTSVSTELIQMEQWDDFQFKSFRIRTWLKGPDLQDNISAGEERLTLDFSFVLSYDISEYNSTCSCFPTPNSNRLANHINNSSYGWNDTSERKEIQIIAWNDQFAGGTFHAINPQISAQEIGSSIRIYGTIDSLEIGSFSNRYLKNLSFDYTVPINP